MQVLQRVAAGFAGLLLAGCSTLNALQDALPLDYQCPHNLRFTARLYRDLAMLDGLRGHAVLARETSAVNPNSVTTATAPLRYADNSVRAEFGLGEQGRLVRLDYTSIPEPIYCTRAAEPGMLLVPLRAANRDGPRPPSPPPDPSAPVKTNLHTRDGIPVRAG